LHIPLRDWCIVISVLYVDDEPGLLELGKTFLEQNASFSVTTAVSGESALALLRETTFDIVVSDFQMPVMDGIVLLRQIRSTSDIPFILFTGRGREEVVIDAINSGADFYLQKGGDPAAQFAELGHKISQAVSRRRAEHALHKRLALIREASFSSTRFIRLRSDRIDSAINGLLANIGAMAGADHCYIALKTGKNGEVSKTHQWTAPGIFSGDELTDTSDSGDFSWAVTRVQASEAVTIPSVAAMPSGPEDAGRQKTWLEKRGIKSFLIIPLTIGPELIGLLGFDTTRTEVVWPDEDIDILKIYGQIIANALARRTADETIRKSEQLYRTVFESTGTAMMILEEDKTVAVVNREMERISGFSRTDIEGKMPWTRFVSPEDLERMKQYHALRRSDPSVVPKNYEFGFLARDGRRISTYITVEMIPGTQKSIVSLIDISREQAARQEMMDSEEKFRSLSESLPEGIYMAQDTRFVYVNPAFTTLFGYTAEQMLALPDYSVIFTLEDRPRIERAVTERLAGIRDSERYSVQGIRQDGAIITVSIHGSRTRYKGRDAIIGTVTRGRQDKKPGGREPGPRIDDANNHRDVFINSNDNF
jgi:PAS domain S-box-containing protein